MPAMAVPGSSRETRAGNAVAFVEGREESEGQGRLFLSRKHMSAVLERSQTRCPEALGWALALTPHRAVRDLAFPPCLQAPYL